MKRVDELKNYSLEIRQCHPCSQVQAAQFGPAER